MKKGYDISLICKKNMHKKQLFLALLSNNQKYFYAYFLQLS